MVEPGVELGVELGADSPRLRLESPNRAYFFPAGRMDGSAKERR